MCEVPRWKWKRIEVIYQGGGVAVMMSVFDEFDTLDVCGYLPLLDAGQESGERFLCLTFDYEVDERELPQDSIGGESGLESSHHQDGVRKSNPDFPKRIDCAYESVSGAIHAEYVRPLLYGASDKILFLEVLTERVDYLDFIASLGGYG